MGYFLRDRAKGNRFDGLFFDPFGQCRSVAFGRIIAFCLGRLDVQVLELKHFSKNRWRWGCCKGECEHCTNDPMSWEKQAVLQKAYAEWLRV